MNPANGDVTPEELKRAVAIVRAGKAAIRLTTPSEVLEAVKLGVIDKNEARRMLGLRKRLQPKHLRRKP